MSDAVRKFRFGNLIFDTEENLLLRDGNPVAITPKAFELLRVLVERHGHLVAKDELMQALWKDRFVEEGNLSYTMRLLRIALDDSRESPHYIETIPKRGYRFIAKVEQILPEPHALTSSSKARSDRAWIPPPFLQTAAIAVIILIVGFGGFWYARSKGIDSDAPIMVQRFSSAPLSTNGKVLHAAISADGKNVIFTNGLEGRQSVWLRQLDTGGNIEIIPPSNDFYDWLELSPDGSVLYFARRPQWSNEPRCIYRVSSMGGVPQKLVSGTEGWMSVSPDSSRISFVRCPATSEENCSLWIADADGKNERKLLSVPLPDRIGDNLFSADGSSIIFASGQSQNASNEFRLFSINIETGAQQQFTNETFFNIKAIAALPGENGFLITAARVPNRLFGIWHVSADGRKIERLPGDPENYNDLSIDRAGTRLVATRISQAFRLFVFRKDEPSAGRVIADGSQTAFAPDGRLVYTSVLTGNDEIWSITPDGAGQRQLTNEPADEGAPIASADSNAFYFASNRSGSAQVWRMNADGSDQVQVTKKEGGSPLYSTPDGRWVYFHHALEKTLWRVGSGEGDEQRLLNVNAHHFAISPDGSMAAFLSDANGEKSLEILSLPDGRPIKRIKVANQRPVVPFLVWMPDGKEIAFASVESEESYVLRLQALDGTPSRSIADLGSERISSIAISPDGTTFAVTKGGWQHNAFLINGLR